MSAIASGSKGNSTRVLPHQTAFVDTVLSFKSKPIVVLRADPGLGKTTAVAYAIVRLLRESVGARVLILCHPGLRIQWADMIKRNGASASIVDRYRFREMLDPSADGGLWPSGEAAVLSKDFAIQPDIRDSLESVAWDLVVADTMNLFTGSRADLLKSLQPHASRMVFIGGGNDPPPDGFSLEDATVVVWQGNDLEDSKGEPLPAPPRPVLNQVRYVQSEAERSLSIAIGALCDALASENRGQRLIRSMLVRCLHSSPAALERILSWLALGPEQTEEMSAGFTPYDGSEAPEPVGALDVPEVARAIAQRALELLEVVQVDSKLGAFGTLMATLTQVETPRRRICVVTEYFSTLFYLAAEIEGRDIPFAVLDGRMTWDAREETLKTFESEGGILLTTTAAVAVMGLEMPDVTDFLMYELPRNKLAFVQVFSRFNRIGRIGPVTIHALVPEDKANPLDSEGLRLMQEFTVERER